MFSKKLKYVLTKPEKFAIYQEEKIIDSAIIAVCILFLQNLVTVGKPDIYQISALIGFSVAIPLVGAHLFVLQTYPLRNVTLPNYVSKMFDYLTIIAMFITCISVLIELWRFLGWLQSLLLSVYLMELWLWY